MRQKDTNLDPTERRIINANRGVSNVVSMADETPHILELLDKFEKLLLNHCGPTTGYAMSVNAQSMGIQFEPNVFTKDGIGILSAVECMAPLENYIRELLCYLGGRVDSAAKDGTTSSILFGISFLKNILSNPDTEKTTSFNKQRIAKEVFESILKTWKKQYVYTVADLTKTASDEEIMQTAGKVAFIQALSSSGGDIELALAMKEIYERSPTLTWDFIDYYQSAVENSKRFTVEIDEYDSRIRCTSALSGILNTSLGTEYYVENPRCFVFTDSFTDYDPRIDSFVFYLKESKRNTPIVVLAPYFPAKIASAAMALNNERPVEGRITLWQYSAEERLAGQALNWELLIPNAVAGVTPYTHSTIAPETPCSDEFGFIAEKVMWRNTFMEFYGTVKSDGVLHPFYAHPEQATPFYQEVVDELMEQKQELENSKIKNMQLALIFTEMLNRVICLHRPKLRLGGPAHEQAANIPVVQDVQGAIMSSLRNGFVVNGMAALIYTLLTMDIENQNEYRAYLSKVLHRVGQDMLNYLYRFSISESVSNEALKEMLNVDKSTYLNTLNNSHGDILSYLHLLKDIEPNKWQDNETIMTNYPVMQPAKITEELFKRVQELLLKFSNTTELIVTGGMLIDETLANATPNRGE